jgi:sec-independent protein translocase protein TatB
MPDMLFILLIALVLLGPKKLPQVAAQIGKYLAQFQRMRRELLDQVNAEVVRMEASQAQLTAASVPVPPAPLAYLPGSAAAAPKAPAKLSSP